MRSIADALGTRWSLFSGRTELFLEVYGNAQIQEKTQIYINRKVKEIRSFLSGSAGLSVSPATLALGSSLYRGIVDLSHLRNKDLDDIDHALDFMTTPNTRPSQQQNQHQPTADGEATSSADGSRSGAPVEAAASASSDVLARVLPQKDPNVFDIVTLRSVRHPSARAELIVHLSPADCALLPLCSLQRPSAARVLRRSLRRPRQPHRLGLSHATQSSGTSRKTIEGRRSRLGCRLLICLLSPLACLFARQASIIHIVHYKKWRMTGLAFEER